jgi:glutathione synthase
VPADDDARANFHTGGRAVRTELTDREREICARIGPVLRDRGVIFAGIDVLGDYLTEINVTSPTGLREIEQLDGIALEGVVLDAVMARVS